MSIADRDSAGSEFAQAAFFSFLFALRAPHRRLWSSGGHIPRARWGFSPPQPDKALMGVRAVGGEPFLFAKFPWRKNMSSGCILRRPVSAT